MKLQIALCALLALACQKNTDKSTQPGTSPEVERLQKRVGEWTESGHVYMKDAAKLPTVGNSRCDAINDGVVCHGRVGVTKEDPTFAWMDTIVWDAKNNHYIKWDQTNQPGLATTRLTGTWNPDTAELTFSGTVSPVKGEGFAVRHVYRYKDDGSVQLSLYEKREQSERKTVEVLKKRH